MRAQAQATAGLLLLVAFGAASCSGDAGLGRLLAARTPIPESVPMPDSPSNLLRLLEWSFNHHSLSQYHELFTADFAYTCPPADSTAMAWRDTTTCRAPEPSRDILSLILDRNFFVYPDPYYVYYPPPNGHILRDPGGRWHKNIRTTVSLLLEGNGPREFVGHATFYVVRGDSALIPDDLKARGFKQDSTRWYIRRWDDDTSLRLP
jgi:hypothetical protein